LRLEAGRTDFYDSREKEEKERKNRVTGTMGNRAKERGLEDWREIGKECLPLIKKERGNEQVHGIGMFLTGGAGKTGQALVTLPENQKKKEGCACQILSPRFG